MVYIVLVPLFCFFFLVYLPIICFSFDFFIHIKKFCSCFWRNAKPQKFALFLSIGFLCPPLTKILTSPLCPGLHGRAGLGEHHGGGAVSGQLGRGLQELLRGRAGERARVHRRAEVSLLCLRADWEGHEQERKDSLNLNTELLR